MPDVSPTKWHRAHVTWFFETFVLRPQLESYSEYDTKFRYLFNSYYQQIGPQYPRPNRGDITRPGAAQVGDYREYVDDQTVSFLMSCSDKTFQEVAPTVELGLHHEQQHQELLLMDIKHVLSRNPLFPPYTEEFKRTRPTFEGDNLAQWSSFESGTYPIGHQSEAFAYDNEGPNHEVVLRSFELNNRLVSCGDWLEFIDDGGYQKPELWLSDGWAHICENSITQPLYWFNEDDRWLVFTLHGLQDVDLSEPVVHVTHFEADAYARWSEARLPTEFEWEVASQSLPDLEMGQAFLSDDPLDGYLHPGAGSGQEGLTQMLGSVWEWTSSAYLPYPGFNPAEGAVGEYNGKFMNNQMVLRGGCCATPADHIRTTYRNFFPSSSSWAFSGLRLARDLD